MIGLQLARFRALELRKLELLKKFGRFNAKSRGYATHRDTWSSWAGQGGSGGPYGNGRRGGGFAGLWSKWKVPILFTGGVLLVSHYVIPPVVNSIPTLRRNPQAVVYGIIGLNVLGWLAWRSPKAYLMARYGLLEKLPQRFNAWQMLGSAFSHQDGWHIFLNMFVLFQFGLPVAQWLGSGNFMTAYLDGCVLSSLGSMLFPALLRSAGQYIPSLGASGAVFTVMGIFSYLAPNAKLALWFIPLPFGAWWVFLGTLAWNAWGMFAPAKFILGRGLDYSGHVAGSLVGIYAGWKLTEDRRRQRRQRISRFGF